MRARLAAAWRRLTARQGREGAEPPRGVLFLSVCDAGWRATVVDDGVAHPPDLSGEAAGLEGAPVPVAEMLRRAIRSMPVPQRARIGEVRLLLSDAAGCIVDNRFARVRATDPASLRDSGARLLGTGGGALHGFQLFGRSSEGETPRGVHAFASAEGAGDLLGALDSLAVSLTRIVPAEVLALAAGGARPFAAIGVQAGAMTLLLADPETGAVASRALPVGVRQLVSAVAEASSVSAKEALAGLARRECLPPVTELGPEAGRSARPFTATEAALRPHLAALQAALDESVEYFTFQRLAGAPEQLLVHGEAARVRGLTEWLGQALGVPAAPLDLHARFVSGEREPGAQAGPNLLESAPVGLLRIGRVNYRFEGGRFEPDRAEVPREVGSAGSLAGLLRRPLSLAALREAAAAERNPRALVLPGLAVLAVAAGLWFAMPSGAGASTEAASEALAAALSEEAAIRAAQRRLRDAPRPDPTAEALPWSNRLLALSQAAPPGLWLTRVAVVAEGSSGRERLVLEGAVPAGPADPLGLITGFVEALSADAAFKPTGGVVFEGAAAESGIVRFTAGVALGERGSAMAGRRAR